MSEINPQNYREADLTLVGYTATEPRKPAYDKDGTSGVLEITIPINEGYKKDGEFIQTGTTWYTYSGAGEFAQSTLAPIAKGTKVRIDGAKQEVREYKDRDGNAKLGITLRFGKLTVLEEPSGGGSSAPSGDPWVTSGNAGQTPF